VGLLGGWGYWGAGLSAALEPLSVVWLEEAGARATIEMVERVRNNSTVRIVWADFPG
jgi:hypothetical protein